MISPVHRANGLQKQWTVYLLGALVMYVSCVPFYSLHTQSLAGTGFHLTKYLPFVLALLVLVLTALRLSDFRVAWPEDGLLAAFVVASLASLAAAEFLLVGVLKLCYYTTTGVALFYVVRNLTPANMQLLTRILPWTAGAVGTYGIVSYGFDRDVLWGALYAEGMGYNPGRANSTLGNPVALGGYLVLLIPLICAGATAATTSRSRAALVTVAGLCSVCLLLTFSRAGWLAGVVMALLWTGLRGLKRREVKEFASRGVITFIFLLLILPVACSLVSVVHETCVTAKKRLLSVGEFSTDTALSFRIAQYATISNVVMEQPVLGVGFGNFTRLFAKRQLGDLQAHAIGSPSHTAENMYGMVAVETGIPGAVAFIGFLTVAVWRMASRFLTAPIGSNGEWMLAVCAGLVGLMVNMLFWDALNHPAVRIMTWTVVGLGYAHIRTDCVDGVHT